MIHLSAEIQGDREMDNLLGVAAKGVSDFSEPLAAVGSDLMKTFDLNFDAEGSILQDGGWPPRKDNNPWPLMMKTGAMRSSFADLVSPSQVTITNYAPYFVYHQSNAPRTRLPRRIMMKITEQARTDIVKTFQGWLHKKLGGFN